MGRKRPKQGSSSSVDEDDMAASKFKSLQNSIDGLNKVVTDGFANIHTDIDNLRFEFKTEIEGIKSTIKSHCLRKPGRGERWGSADFLQTFTI